MKERMKPGKLVYVGGIAFWAVLALCLPAFADDGKVAEHVTELSYSFDTFYLLITGALVMWMAAGFTMLEAGLVRSKNTVEILLKNIALYAVACIMYMVVGYRIMYGGGEGGVVPGFGFLLPSEHGLAAVLAGEAHSKLADFFFQVVFVATAMSIVSGAVAERMKLWAFLLFSIVMTAFIYPVEGYWHWGAGFLSTKVGFYDFAGSGVVHLCGASAAIAGVLLLGPRKGKYVEGRIHAIPGANLPLATLGTLVLWFGWFGFNGGSQLAVSSVENANAVAKAFVDTNMAACGGLVAAMVVACFWFGKSDLTMALNGALAGLVAITADPTSPSPLLATFIGVVAGVFVVFAIVFIDKAKIDDPVGALSVHGVSGIWGLLAVCLSNPKSSLVGQLTGIVCIFAWVFITSFIVWLIIKKVMGLRVTEEEELKGCDFSECGLEAYPEFTKER